MVKPTDNLMIVGKAIPLPKAEELPLAPSKVPKTPTVEEKPEDTFHLDSPKNPIEVASIPEDTAGNSLSPIETKPSRPDFSDPLLNGGAVVVSKAGERWTDVLDRHYGVEVPLALVERIAYAHESSSGRQPPGKIIAPSLEELYRDLHSSDGGRGRKIVKRSDIIIVEAGQSLEEVLKAHYMVEGGLAEEDLDEDFIKIASMAVSVINGGSRYTGKPLVVAMPSVDDLGKLVERLHFDMERMNLRREAWRNTHNDKGDVDNPAIRQGDGSGSDNSDLISQGDSIKVDKPKIKPTNDQIISDIDSDGDSGVIRFNDSEESGPEITQIAVAGKYYQPELGEKMGDVAAYVYRQHLTESGLSPAEAEIELQKIMLAVTQWNRLKTLDIGNVPAIYWPSISQLEHFRQHPRVRLQGEKLKEGAPHLWNAIVATSANAQARAETAKKLVVSEQGSAEDQLKAIESASDTVFMMQLEQMWSDPDFWEMDMYGPVWYDDEEFFEDDEVYPGELAARKPNETVEEYAQRLFDDTLAPYEIAEFAERPEFLVAVHLGIMNRNGEFEPGEKEALVAGLSELGLMDENGNIITDEDATPASIDAKTVAILNEKLDLDLEREPGEPIDAFLERANWYVWTPDQQDAIKQLWLWNTMAKSGVSDIGSVESELNGFLGVDGAAFDFYYDDDVISEYQEMLMLDESLWLDDPWAVEEEIEVIDQSELESEADSLLKATRAELIRSGVRLELMTREQTAEFRESFKKLMLYLAEVEKETAEYHEKLVIGARVCATRILNGESIGAPMTWYA